MINVHLNGMIICTHCMQGYYKQKAYIAAQGNESLNMVRSLCTSWSLHVLFAGPLPNSLEDFWRMVWEQKLPTIVMLTKCFEERVNTPNACFYHRFHKHVCVCLNRKNVSATGLTTRKSHSLLAMTLGSPSTSQAQFLFRILSSGKWQSNVYVWVQQCS